MGSLAKIFIENEERNILNSDFLYHQATDNNGNLRANVKGGLFTVQIESTPNDEPFYYWMSSPFLMKKGYIRFYKPDGIGKLFDFEFWDCYCVKLIESFRALGPDPDPMNLTLTLSPGIHRIRGIVYEEFGFPVGSI